MLTVWSGVPAEMTPNTSFSAAVSTGPPESPPTLDGSGTGAHTGSPFQPIMVNGSEVGSQGGPKNPRNICAFQYASIVSSPNRIVAKSAGVTTVSNPVSPRPTMVTVLP
jgi:hypothetical protein